MTEAAYQRHLIRKLEKMFPGCVILKNDPSYCQGMLDLSVLYGDQWAMLEVKAHADAVEQPNQAYYVAKMNDMSFAAFICPENEQEVLDALQEAFASRGSTCVPQS